MNVINLHLAMISQQFRPELVFVFYYSLMAVCVRSIYFIQHIVMSRLKNMHFVLKLNEWTFMMK